MTPSTSLRAGGSYTTGDLGVIFHVSADTVRRHWPEWHRLKGFPKPQELPAGNRRALLRWDKTTVDGWRALQGAVAPAAEAAIDAVDWAAVARARGHALLQGRDPDFVSV